MTAARATGDGLELYWIPLGAGSSIVPVAGGWYEALCARREHRPRADIYHAALVAYVEGRRTTVEMAPAWGSGSGASGVVGSGPVGLRGLGRWRWFRYEIRCWAGGEIPDLAAEVGGAHRLTEDAEVVAAVLDAVRRAPRLTWGRDELGADDMWNSNSLVAWSLYHAGLDARAARVTVPPGGRAPGWSAGVAAARRSLR